MAYAISTKGLSKKYGSYHANDDITINIEEGAIYGLIGRNGAGKTTFMRMLLGLSKPTKGEMSLLGKDVFEARRETGSIIETPAFYQEFTAYQNLEIRAKLLGLNHAEAAIQEALREVDLLDKKNQRVKEYSLGMRQSLGIACAILGDPKLLILDEPINGLDPIAIANIRNILLKLNKKGVTILISSHILGEMEKIATHYGFIKKGKLVKEITEKEVKEKNIDLEQLFIELVGGIVNE
ncbi:MAG: ATP-binding cassette domain-containing protein [Erysipelotrichaceae bacterium]